MKKCTFLILFYSALLCGQESLSNKEALVWFDSIVGHENLAICAGEKHSENYRTVRGQYPFLFDNTYHTSEVKYDGQLYYNVQIKYHVSDDELIALIPTAIDRYPIVLSKTKLTHFYIDDKKFVNLKNDFGYVQVVSEKASASLYKKYIKRKIEKTVRTGVVFEFRERENYLLFYRDQYVTVSSKKDWIQQFPDQKSKIKSFYSSNRKLLKSDTDTFMSNLFNVLIQN